MEKMTTKAMNRFQRMVQDGTILPEDIDRIQKAIDVFTLFTEGDAINGLFAITSENQFMGEDLECLGLREDLPKVALRTFVSEARKAWEKENGQFVSFEKLSPEIGEMATSLKVNCQKFVDKQYEVGAKDATIVFLYVWRKIKYFVQTNSKENIERCLYLLRSDKSNNAWGGLLLCIPQDSAKFIQPENSDLMLNKAIADVVESLWNEKMRKNAEDAKGEIATVFEKAGINPNDFPPEHANEETEARAADEQSTVYCTTEEDSKEACGQDAKKSMDGIKALNELADKVREVAEFFGSSPKLLLELIEKMV